MAGQSSLLKELHTFRKVRGVIGICHCPAVTDLSQAYARFEQICKCASPTPPPPVSVQIQTLFCRCPEWLPPLPVRSSCCTASSSCLMTLEPHAPPPLPPGLGPPQDC